MVRRGDDDGINIAPLQQLAKIDKRRAAAISAGLALGRISAMNALDGILAPLAMDIAHGHDLHAAIAEKSAQMPAPHHADADEAKIDAAVGPLPPPRLLLGAFLSVGVGFEDERNADRAGEELPTLDGSGHGENRLSVGGWWVRRWL